ncbi:hypothetical protein L207DRAFT_424172 [Hyaloscypha variabilis F]|uniref:Oxidase ustYa n=1 Tax=Hyaloscypha variabilis (strain UAMH 11265 / GT02V1 / F) TaxID=1149755 RepID=A0A2J6RWG5_HYAVF|nr:hypothetical protein L207DRAFT_424172 [Hyaloscypha variabilis F]
MVSSTDDQEKLLSSNEIHEASMDDEKQWHSLELDAGRRLKANKFTMAFGSYRWLIDAFLILVITGLLLLLHDQSKDSQGSIQVGGDSTGAGPTFPTQAVKFESDMSFTPKNTSEFFTDETLDSWKKLMPAGTRFGSIGEPFSTTSMTHQLHCVYMMARIFSGIVSNNTQKIPDDYYSHFFHCIDYLRQGIMCSADLALEAHDAMDPDDLGPLDGGWSGIHVCKDYSQVISYLEGQIAEGVRVVLPIDD